MRLRHHGGVGLAIACALTGPASAAISAAHSPGLASAAPLTSVTRPHNGFSASGPWNRPLPSKVPLAPNSAAIVKNIVHDMRNNFGTWALNTDKYSSPIFTAGPGTPAQNWTYTNCQRTGGGQVIASSFAHVPTPRNLIASRGTDKATAIYQPSTDTYWDFWRAQKNAHGHWSACWGGKIANYSTNPGIFAHPLGATATGLPLGAFVIRISELEHGKIDHAINLITVRTRARCFSWPASRDDGNTTGSNIPCEGQRFRLNPHFDAGKLYSPVARMIARALQVYGAIITDKGGAVVTQAQDPRPYEKSHRGVNPYPALLDPKNRYPGYAQYAVLAEIPLNQLQALPLSYGKPRSR
jgi:hypothetical protein